MTVTVEEVIVNGDLSTYKFLVPYEVPGVCDENGQPLQGYQPVYQTEAELLNEKSKLEAQLTIVNARLGAVNDYKVNNE